MSIDIELAQGFDFIAKEFNPHRQRRLPRVKIDNPPANGEVTARRYLRNALVTGVSELLKNAFHLLRSSASKLNGSGGESARFGRGLIEAGAGRDDNVRPRIALDQRKQRETFGRDFRVRQNVFDRGEFCFRQEKRVGTPVEQTFVQQFLRVNARAEDPNRLVDLACERSDEKWLR